MFLTWIKWPALFFFLFLACLLLWKSKEEQKEDGVTAAEICLLFRLLDPRTAFPDDGTYRRPVPWNELENANLRETHAENVLIFLRKELGEKK